MKLWQCYCGDVFAVCVVLSGSLDSRLPFLVWVTLNIFLGISSRVGLIPGREDPCTQNTRADPLYPLMKENSHVPYHGGPGCEYNIALGLDAGELFPALVPAGRTSSAAQLRIWRQGSEILVREDQTPKSVGTRPEN